MPKRQTIAVQRVKELANSYLEGRLEDPRIDAHYRKGFRDGVAALAFAILHETSQYRGFNYREWLEGGYDRWVADGQPRDTTPYLGDESRIVIN